MASIVKRNKSFSVVYTSYESGKKKQRWETYHSYEAALHRKEQVELIQAKQKERLQSNADNCLVHNKNTQNCRGASSKLQREFPQ